MNKTAVTSKAVTLRISVVPRASKSEIVGFRDDALKVRIAAPPVDGAENVELVKVLAKYFNVSKSAVEIVGGETSKRKIVKIGGITTEHFEAILKAKS